MVFVSGVTGSNVRKAFGGKIGRQLAQVPKDERFEQSRQVNEKFAQLLRQYDGDLSKVPQAELVPFAEYLQQVSCSGEIVLDDTTTAGSFALSAAPIPDHRKPTQQI